MFSWFLIRAKPPISQTIKGEQDILEITEESLYKLIKAVLLSTSTNGHTSVDRPAKSYINQLCADTEFHQ